MKFNFNDRVSVKLTVDGAAHLRRGVPPFGWECTRPAGHDGPCAAIPARTPPCVGHEHVTDEQITQHAQALMAQRLSRLESLLQQHGGLDLWYSDTGTTLVIGSCAFTAGSLARAIDMATEGTR